MKTVSNSAPQDAGAAIAGKIALCLSRGQRALFLASGGSSADVVVDACARLRTAFIDNGEALKLLSVTLVDERYGPVGHADSNWRLLLGKGFDPSPFDACPVLDGSADGVSDEGLAATTERFAEYLARAAARHSRGDLFIAAAFGIGADGHTAGLLPGTAAASLDPGGAEYATGYRTATYARVTMAPAFFAHIDYAALWVNDSAKRDALERMSKPGPFAEIPARLVDRAREAVLFRGDAL
jgi:6-phosphogluconolactonase/glucosamine-6-phosphate isomerase/deaminase